MDDFLALVDELYKISEEVEKKTEKGQKWDINKKMLIEHICRIMARNNQLNEMTNLIKQKHYNRQAFNFAQSNCLIVCADDDENIIINQVRYTLKTLLAVLFFDDVNFVIRKKCTSAEVLQTVEKSILNTVHRNNNTELQFPNYNQMIYTGDIFKNFVDENLNKNEQNLFRCVNPGHISNNEKLTYNMLDQNNRVRVIPPKKSSQTYDVWVSVSYYEEDTKISDPFVTFTSSCVIDGYSGTGAAPKNTVNKSLFSRFCIGNLPNIKVCFSIEKCRRLIGAGIELKKIYLEDEENSVIKIKNHSNHPVFVQSLHYNLAACKANENVHKLLNNEEVTVFDYNEFATRVQHALAQSYNEVYKMIKHCVVHLSFIKGWGDTYQRKFVTQTPCWLEIKFTQPLDLLDKALIYSVGPSDKCSSRT